MPTVTDILGPAEAEPDVDVLVVEPDAAVRSGPDRQRSIFSVSTTWPASGSRSARSAWLPRTT